MQGKRDRGKYETCHVNFPLDRNGREWQDWLRTIKMFMSRGELNPIVLEKHNDNRDYVFIDILGISYIGLLDSGANRTVINSDLAQSLKSMGLKTYRSKDIQVATADGNRHNITEIIDVPVKFNGHFNVVKMMVMPNLSQKVLLGKDFFSKFGIFINFKGDSSDYCQMISTLSSQESSVISKQDLSDYQQATLDTLIYSMKQTIGSGLGRTHIIKHEIDTEGGKPIHQKQYNFSPVIRREIERELDEMLAKDVVEPSHSPWCSPVLIVKKPNGENRLCLDSRQLNKVTKRDTYPLPRVSNILDNLKNAKFLSTIDLKSAFWQISLDEASKEKTAFAVPGRGLFHFKVMPFGLVNASQTQQRLMDILFHALEGRVWAYLDDIVICSASFEEHLETLGKVMHILKEANLTINVDKCKFARPSLKFLGYIVDKDGLRTDPDKVSAILNFPRPRNITELKRFIGLASWYRRFVKDFSMVAAPLHNLTKAKKNKKLTWNDEAETSFTELKTLLTTTPVMSCPDYSKPFIVQCDASSKGIGAVLCQKVEGNEQAIAFLSRKLTDREKQYSTSERELLSVVHAIEKFRPYIDGTRFTVITDHSALQWLHKMKDPHGRLARWAMKLQQFNFEIVHRPGKSNTVPDALSRSIELCTEINLVSITENNKDEWYKSKVDKILSGRERDLSWNVRDGLLFKKVKLRQFPNCESIWKLFIPTELRSKIIRECHDETKAGHFGIRKTLFRVKQFYYWPNIIHDVKQYIKSCETCAKFKVPQQLPLGHMGHHREVTGPWQVISLDLMGPFPKSKLCHTMLLVITCWFSKFTLMFPLRTGKTEKICEILENQILLFGAPKAIICDNGKQFASNLFQDLALKYNYKIWFTPNYHPQSNPTERVNRVIGTMLSSYISSKKHNEWDVNLKEIAHAIRTAVHETTGYTPSYLFLGRETSTSSSDTGWDLGSNTNINNLIVDTKPFIESQIERHNVFKTVTDNMKKSHIKSSNIYNHKRNAGSFQIGDVIWKRTKYLSNANKKFMAKLAPKFEKAIVTAKLSDSVYRLNNVYGKPIGMWHIKDLKAL